MQKLTTLSLLATLFFTQSAFAEISEQNFWNVQTSVYTKHFDPKPEHNNHQDLIGADYNLADGWFYGGATFRNSFRQHSVYGYGGKKLELNDTPFYSRISGGLIHGYHGKYKHKIPMNDLGIAPAIIPSVGVQVSQFNTEMILLGFNAMMVNVGYSFK